MRGPTLLGKRAPHVDTCINVSGVTLRRGTPVMRVPNHAYDAAVQLPRWGGGTMAGRMNFAGVMQEALVSNALGDQGQLIYEGRCMANFHSQTAADNVRGAYLYPVQIGNEGYFRVVAYNTGIRLAADYTTLDASTYYLVDTGGGVEVEIEPGVGWRGPVLHAIFVASVATDTDALLNDQATSNSVATTVTDFLLDGENNIPRNVVITPGGTTGDVAAGDYVITGTDGNGDAITETIVIAANASTAQVGSKAFKTVTQIVFPIQDGSAATFDVGWGVKLGLPRTFATAPVCIEARADGVTEGTAPTIAVDADELCKNTISFNTAPDSSNRLEAWLLAV